MPGKNHVFTACVDPISPPPEDQRTDPLVEAPGTAPGSAPSIPQSVYRHSQLPDRANIGANA